MALDGVELVHLTGITTALGDSARELVVDVARRARARGITVTFDPNYRPALWRSAGDAVTAQVGVLGAVDWYFCGLDEGRTLFGADTPEEVVAAIRAAGAGEVVLRDGARGALVRDGERLREIPHAHVVDVVDEVGAGDAFAAGFVHGLLEGSNPVDCARVGNAVAARALRGTGDWETLPQLAELQR